MSAWQPIETAPKDGTEIFVCVTYSLPNEEWLTAQWVDWQNGEGAWAVFQRSIQFPFRPTHWQPLPAPPSDEATS